MSKIKQIGLVSFLAMAAAQVNASCDHFKIIIKNNLPFVLNVVETSLQGGELRFYDKKVPAYGAEASILVQKSAADGIPMLARLIFTTSTLPKKQATIQFKLVSEHAVCRHTSYTSQKSDMYIYTAFQGTEVKYIIDKMMIINNEL